MKISAKSACRFFCNSADKQKDKQGNKRGLTHNFLGRGNYTASHSTSHSISQGNSDTFYVRVSVERARNRIFKNGQYLRSYNLQGCEGTQNAKRV